MQGDASRHSGYCLDLIGLLFFPITRYILFYLLDYAVIIKLSLCTHLSRIIDRESLLPATHALYVYDIYRSRFSDQKFLIMGVRYIWLYLMASAGKDLPLICYQNETLSSRTLEELRVNLPSEYSGIAVLRHV